MASLSKPVHAVCINWASSTPFLHREPPTFIDRIPKHAYLPLACLLFFVCAVSTPLPEAQLRSFASGLQHTITNMCSLAPLPVPFGNSGS